MYSVPVIEQPPHCAQQTEGEPHSENRAIGSEHSRQHIYQHTQHLHPCYDGWCGVLAFTHGQPLHLCPGSYPSHLVKDITLALTPSLKHYQICPLHWIIPTSIQTFFSIFHLKKLYLSLASPSSYCPIAQHPFPLFHAKLLLKVLLTFHASFFFNIYINLFIYLFMAALGLCCCAWAFSSCSKRGLLFVALCRLLIAVAFLVVEHGLQVLGLQQLWHVGSVVVTRGLQSAGSVVVAHGLSCSVACGIFLDQGSNWCPLHWQVDSQSPHHQGSPHLSHFLTSHSFLNSCLSRFCLFCFTETALAEVITNGPHIAVSQESVLSFILTLSTASDSLLLTLFLHFTM